MTALARWMIKLSALLTPRADRARFREEWLGELAVVTSRGSAAALRFALGAPRDAWSMRPPMRLLSAVGVDATYAVRQLLRRPAHTVAVIACLAIGLVASVATFSVISSLFYGDMAGISGRRTLSQIQLAYDTATSQEGAGGGARVTAEPMSFNDFAAFRTGPLGSALTAIGAEARLRFTAIGNHGPLSVKGAFASADFFNVLRTPVVTGRFFAETDDRPDAPPVVVIGDYFWRTQLDGRDDAIGRTVLLGGLPYTVIGVAPRQFHGLQTEVGEPESEGVQLWMPLAQMPAFSTRPGLDDRVLGVIGRRTADAAPADVERQLSIAAARVAASNPSKRANASARVRPFGFTPDNAPIEVLAIMGAIFALPLTVLAIGCANVANLQLARVAEQSRELAIRLSLGATRAQLLRLLTAETLARVLVAIALSLGVIALIFARIQPLFPIFVSLDWRVMLFAITLSAGVALGTGTIPAWLVLRRAAAGQLKQTAQSGGLGHRRLRGSLVVAQVALSLCLLVLTGLFARTVQAIAGAAPAALHEQVVADFDPSDLQLSPAEASRFAQTIAARVAADPRVRHVSISSGDSARFGVPSAPKDRDVSAALVSTSAAWIDVMDLKLLTGRRLSDNDDPSNAVLSLRAADEIAPNASPLGMVLRVTADAIERQVRVVGVVADSHNAPTASRPGPVIYVPFPKELKSYFTLRVRADDPDALSADLMSLVNQIDPRIAWTSLRRGDGPFEQDSKEMSYLAYAIGVGGLVAMVLSATGLYAVMSYVVTLRRREIGVRLAIGAPPAGIVSLMLGQSMTLVAIGIGAGLLLAVPLACALRAMLIIEGNPANPILLLPAMLALAAAGVAASIVPSLRASRVDPISTLRQD